MAARPRVAYAIELSTFPTLGRVRMELATMVLLEQPEPSRAKVPPVVIVAPYAVHHASVADFAPGHSLAQTLAEADAGSVALTFWKSATAEMRDYGIDAYLSDLNVAIDDLGGRASLVGRSRARLGLALRRAYLRGRAGLKSVQEYVLRTWLGAGSQLDRRSGAHHAVSVNSRPLLEMVGS